MKDFALARQIIIEGLDLTGKTSLCARLKELSDPSIIFRKALLGGGEHLFQIANAFRDSGKLDMCNLGYLYLSALEMDVDSQKPCPDRLVQESCAAYRLAAYYRSRGVGDLTERLESLISSAKFPVFDKGFVLTCTIERRRERLELRRRLNASEITADDLLVESAPDMVMRNERFLVAILARHTSIELVDTSDFSINELAEYVMERAGLDRTH